MKTLQGWLDKQRPFLLILLLFISFRLLALLLLRPGGFFADNSDFDYYYAWGQLLPMGYEPFVNSWSTYPPLFPALMLPTFELASRLPPWNDARLWFHILFGFELLLFDIGNLILINRLARRIEDEQRTSPEIQPAIFYALLFLPLYTMLGFFEVMPLFFLLLGIDLLTSRWRGGWAASAVAIGLGFLVKLTPIIFVPVAIRWLWQRSVQQGSTQVLSVRRFVQPLLYLLITAITILGLGYPLVRGNLELGLSSLKIQSIRPPWQSIWALLDGYYGFGLVPIDVRNIDGLSTYQWQGVVPWAAVTFVFGLTFFWLYTRPFDWQKTQTVLSFTGLSVIGLLLYSKGWSPQFLVWVLAFVVLLLPTPRALVISVWLMLINAVEAFVYLIILPDQHWLLWGTVIARTLLLLILALDFLSLIWQQRRTAQIITHWNRVAGWSGVAVITLAGFAAIPKANDAYWTSRLANHPCPGVVEKLQQESLWPNHLIVTNRVENWQYLYPWLRSEYDFIIVDRYGINDENSRLSPDDALYKSYMERISNGEFWYLGRGPDELFNFDLPKQMNTESTSFEIDDLEVIEAAPWNGESQWSRCVLMRLFKNEIQFAGRIAVPEKPNGLIDGSIRLAHLQLGKASPGADFHFVLYWQPWLPTTESYTVFTQLVDSSGVVIAQKDNLPVQGLAPTNTWSARVIRDPYKLAIPTTAAAGSYQLYVGMYDSNLNRLPITVADGTVVDHFTFPIELVTQ